MDANKLKNDHYYKCDRIYFQVIKKLDTDRPNYRIIAIESGKVYGSTVEIDDISTITEISKEEFELRKLLVTV